MNWFTSGMKNVPAYVADAGAIQKPNIHFHKSYRKLSAMSWRSALLSFLVLSFIPVVLLYLFYPQITWLLCRTARAVLAHAIPADLIEITSRGFINKHVYLLTLPGLYPSNGLAVAFTLVSLAILFMALMVKRAKEPKIVWIIFICFINISSGLFFTFFAEYFPYDMLVFSEMYLKTQVGIWFIIPYIMAIALIPLPSANLSKFFTIVVTLAYSFLFACVRYIVFLYLLRKISYIFMALMFFMFGPFLDFTYLVGVYSFYLHTVGKRFRQDMSLWHWSY